MTTVPIILRGVIFRFADKIENSPINLKNPPIKLENAKITGAALSARRQSDGLLGPRLREPVPRPYH